jgi:methionine sulfoxide reductase heme-binding subunit
MSAPAAALEVQITLTSNPAETMSKQVIVVLKTIFHLLCLLPFASLIHFYTSGALALNADPVNYITHFTGDWALYLLLACLAITPVRRLSPSIAWLIRFRRLVGLYAFFYASLHLATYVFLFSGYDLPTAIASLRAGHPGELVTQWKQVWPGIVDDLLKRRFIKVGFFAWCMLLLLALTSPAIVLRAMGGKNWQRLHRLIYFAAILGIIHFWWLVKTGVRTPWKVTAILTVLLLSRVVYSALKRFRKARAASVRVA